MLEILKAFIIGIIQGFTEFLPVSSSGHIEISKALLDLNLEANQSLLFTLTLHTATALSTLVVFRKEIYKIIKGIFRGEHKQVSFAVKIFVSMIPAGLVGFFLKDTINQFFVGNIVLVGSMLLLTALLLLFADKAKTTNKDISLTNAILIGSAQAIAILPGISRSGATISTSVLLGNDRSKAAMFSFLMVIPLIFGAMAKDILDANALEFSNEMLSTLSIGFFAAFLSGIIACKWMISLVRKAKLWYFSVYCTAVGIIAISYTLL